MTFAQRLSLVVMLVVASLGKSAGAEDAAALAKDILALAETRPGLCVHVGVETGQLVTALAGSRKLVIHGLVADAANLETVRKFILDQGRYGQVSAELLDGAALPYADNIVNLLIADLDVLGSKAPAEAELLRVVAPLGIAYLKSGGAWKKTVKPFPAEMGEWTHTMGASDGGRTTPDSAIRPPTGIRWIAGPAWPRYGRKANYNAGISANGRLFFATDVAFCNQGKTLEGRRWALVCRDAFNGLHLWERPWRYHESWQQSKRYPKPSEGYGNAYFPAWAVRGDFCYVPADKGLEILDARTGNPLKEVDLGGLADTLVISGDVLVAATLKRLHGLDSKTGDKRWEKEALPVDPAISDNQVFFLDAAKEPYDLVCLDLETGAEKWRKGAGGIWPRVLPPDDDPAWNLDAKFDKVPKDGPGRKKFIESLRRKSEEVLKERSNKKLAIRLAREGVVVLAHMDAIHGLSAADGERLWSFSPDSFNTDLAHMRASPREVLFVDGLLWTRDELDPKYKATYNSGHKGVDLKTGQVKKIVPDGVPGRKLGCTLYTATSRYILGRNTVVDVKEGREIGFRGGRSTCNIGYIPSNGLMYAGPNNCGCGAVMMRGYYALSSDPVPGGKPVLFKGPAYGAAGSGGKPSADDWPMYRRDPARSSASPGAVPSELRQLWEVRLAERAPEAFRADWDMSHTFGDPLTAPVIAQGAVLVGLQDQHRIAALDAETGKIRWTFFANGRLHAPPTVVGDLCAFGTQAGDVTCLRLRDGALVWRLQASPRDKRIMAFGQLESVWPVGPVWTNGEVLAFLSGRSMASDGGINVCAVSPETGQVLWRVPMPAGELVESRIGPGTVLLAGDGQYLYARGRTLGRVGENGVRFDLKSGGKPEASTNPLVLGGIYSGEWRGLHASLHQNRGVLRYGNAGDAWLAGAGGGGEGGPSMVLLCFNDKTVYGFGGDFTKRKSFVQFAGTAVFRITLDQAGRMTQTKPDWSLPLKAPMQMEAMVLAGDTLIAAGPPDGVKRDKGELWVIRAETGEVLKKTPLQGLPVYDGMAAANGRLYMATSDGRLVCYGQ